MAKNNTKPAFKSKAPYNFIGLENFVLDRCGDEKELSMHGKYHENLKTGYLTYEIETVSLLHISDGDGKLFKNPAGKYVIPGNTIRGMTRYNASIFSFSSVINEAHGKEDIKNRRFYFRTFASKDTEMSKWYKIKTGFKQYVRSGYRFSILEKVHAGYMRKRGNEYIITPAVKLENTRTREGNQPGKMHSYTPIHEYELRSKNISGIKYLYKSGLKREDYKKKEKLKENRESNFVPYYCDINYSINNGKAQVDINGKHKGMIANSDYIEGKVHHYLIFEEDRESAEIVITKEQAELYEEDLNYTNKLHGKKHSYYALPKNGEVKPVFYIKDDEGVVFGFTPYLRLSAKGSIHDGIPKAHMEYEGVDFVDAMFGWKDFKTKLSFQDAVCESDNPRLTENYEIVLGEPKPSWYRGYLKQRKENSLESYNTEGFEIRGRKFYWMKKDIEGKNIGNREDSESKISTVIKCYDEKTKFKGKVVFENLSDEELGLLIYSLKQGDTEGYFNIGKGKPYGFGKCKIKITGLKIEDINAKYSSFNPDFEKSEEIEKYIDSFKKYIVENYKKKVNSVNEIKSYREFELSKKTIENDKAKYMKVGDFAKKAELPDIEDVINEDGDVVSNKMGSGKMGSDKGRNHNGAGRKNDYKKHKNKTSGSGDRGYGKYNEGRNRNLNTNAFDILKNLKLDD